MEAFIALILDSGRSAVDLALYILMPVLVIMMALMSLFEAKGFVALIARILAPLLIIFGIPGIGVFSILQLLLVSFAAPIATLAIMEKSEQDKRKIAATLAMVFTMSQANATFPLIAIGLNLWVTILTSLFGGLLASSLTFYVFARPYKEIPGEIVKESPNEVLPPKRKKSFAALMEGGEQGLQVVIKAIPMLTLAIFAVNIFKATDVIHFLEIILSPAMELVGLPGVAILPIITKYLAGGTAMMGVTINLFQEGAITALEINRIAGFIINPFDMVGVTLLISAGPRIASVTRPAAIGAVIGIITRGVLHLLIF